MTLIELEDLEQGSEEWLDARRGLVTASTVGALVSSRLYAAFDYACPACAAPADSPCFSKVKKEGAEPTTIKTPHPERVSLSVSNRDTSPRIVEVANDDTSRRLTSLLVAERVTGWTDPVYVSEDMLRGQMEESRAVAYYADHYNVPVRTLGFMTEDQFGFTIGYSPDGLVGDDGLLEVKSRRSKKQLETILADEVPIENMAQLQCGLLVSGRNWADYVSFSNGMPLYVKRVLPDPSWFAAIVSAVSKFEETAAQMVAAYDTAITGLAQTDRVSLDNLGLVF